MSLRDEMASILGELVVAVAESGYGTATPLGNSNDGPDMREYRDEIINKVLDAAIEAIEANRIDVNGPVHPYNNGLDMALKAIKALKEGKE